MSESPFQDLTQSMWADVLQQVHGDEAKARDLVSGMTSVSEAEKNEKLAEARAMFPTLSQFELEQTLAGANWQIDDAIEPLFNLTKEKEHQILLAREEEKRQRYRAAQERACIALNSLLTPEAKAELQEILDKNEGDVEESVEEFLRKHQQQQEQQKEDQEARQIEAILNQVPDNINRTDIETHLAKCSGDISKTIQNLLILSKTRKIAQLRAHCNLAKKKVTEERLERTLVDASWNVLRAREILLRVVESDEEDDACSERILEDDICSRSVQLVNAVMKDLKSEKELQTNALKETLNQRLREENFSPFSNPKPVAVLQRLPPPVEAEPDNLNASEVQSKKPSMDSHIMEEKGSQAISLIPSSDRVDKSETLKVKWVSNVDGWVPNKSDWIGIFQVDAESYYTYQWISLSSDSVEFSLNRIPYGDYCFKYFSAVSKSCLGVSSIVSIGPLYNMTPLSGCENGVNQVILKVEQKSGDVPSSSAWVGMYSVTPNQPVVNKNYITYKRWSVAKNNTLVFDLPKTGDWEFRLFPLNNYQHASSCRITIAGTDQLALRLDNSVAVPQIYIDVDLQTKEISEAPWVGVYRVDESNQRMYRRYKYISTNGKSVIQFKAPIHTGQYEARLFSSSSYEEVLAKSNTILIVGI